MQATCPRISRDGTEVDIPAAWSPGQADSPRQPWEEFLKRNDKNGDGVLTKDEFPPFVAKMSMMDTNGDGTVTRDEMKAAHAAHGTQTPPTPPN